MAGKARGSKTGRGTYKIKSKTHKSVVLSSSNIEKLGKRHSKRNQLQRNQL